MQKKKATADISLSLFERAYQQGYEIGFRRGVLKVLLRQSKYLFGVLDSDVENRIRNLTNAELDDLGLALLNFSNLADLTTWLSQHEAVESK